MAYFVENCWNFPISKLGKQILSPGGDKSGKALVLNQSHLLVVDFKVIPGDKPRVVLSWELDKTVCHDTIYLTTAKLTFGSRIYWLCGMCGKPAFKIFHRWGYYGWSCERCLSLKHAVQYCNKYSTPGRIQYWINRLNKVKELEVDLKHCPKFYRRRPTKRFGSYLKIS